jgi:hypothetical protein
VLGVAGYEKGVEVADYGFEGGGAVLETFGGVIFVVDAFGPGGRCEEGYLGLLRT